MKHRSFKDIEPAFEHMKREHFNLAMYELPPISDQDDIARDLITCLLYYSKLQANDDGTFEIIFPKARFRVEGKVGSLVSDLDSMPNPSYEEEV